MPNSATLPSRGRHRGEMGADRVLAERSTIQARAVAALVIVSMVVKVFEATRNSVRAGSSRRQRVADVGAVDVGDEVEARAVLPWARARDAIRGPRSEPPMPILTTSVNLPPAPRDLAGADAVGEGRHGVEDLVDVGHHVLAGDAIDVVGPGAERDVEDGAVLGAVDRLAGEHRRPPALDVGGPREREEPGHRLGIDAGSSSSRGGGRGTTSRSA